MAEEEVVVEDSADSEPAEVPARSSSVTDEVVVVMVVEDSEELEPVAVPARSYSEEVPARSYSEEVPARPSSVVDVSFFPKCVEFLFGKH